MDAGTNDRDTAQPAGAESPEARTPLAEERAAGATALLVIDMISTWDFPDADRLGAAALQIAPRIAALKARCAAAGVPAIYANDNRGRWRSEFGEVVDCARRAGGAARRIVEQLLPSRRDYQVLKPKHSAFYATPLGLLLEHLKVRRLLIAGVTTDQCILITAADACMRDLEIVVPRDCVATLSDERNERTMRHLSEVLCADIRASDQIELPGGATPE